MAYKNAELRKWNQRPFESALSSQAANARFAACSCKPAKKVPVMCRWCGSVFVASADRIRKAGKSGEFYCDRECACKHRSHLYKGNDAIHDPIRKARGVKRRYPHSKVHLKNCKRCGVAFFARNKSATMCSQQCSDVHDKERNRIRSWVTNRRKLKQNAKVRECWTCGVVFTAITRPDANLKCCSEKCYKKAERNYRKHVRRERMSLPDGVYRGNVSLKHVFKKYRGICQLCGCKCEMTKTYSPNQATVDHIVPLAKGGLHTQENVQLACQECNSDKSDSLATNVQLNLPL
jgi:5-methylcytosine-specific restriction endonuclease McrA